MDRESGEPYRRSETERGDVGNEITFPQSDAVADLSRLALQGLEFDRLLDETCLALGDLLEADYVGVFQLRPDREDLILRAGLKWPQAHIGEQTLTAIPGSQIEYTLETWKPTVVQDIREDDRFQRPELMAKAGIVSGVTVVIPAPVNPWGVIGVHATRPRAFSEHDTTFVQAMGHIPSEAVTLRRIEHEKNRYEKSNRRLEQFAYTVSHDLQEPLRMSASYLDLVKTRYGQDFDEEIHELIDHAIDGAHRGQQMVKSMLGYARVSSETEQLERVDANAVMEDVRADMAHRIAETNAEVTVDELPTVAADPRQLAQVFYNLVSNALTYHGEEPPRVHVSAERWNEGWRFSVRDEGIGIEPENADQIFEIFTQLDEDAGGGRDRAGDLPATRRTSRWPALGRKRTRRGLDVPLHDARSRHDVGALILIG